MWYSSSGETDLTYIAVFRLRLHTAWINKITSTIFIGLYKILTLEYEFFLSFPLIRGTLELSRVIGVWYTEIQTDHKVILKFFPPKCEDFDTKDAMTNDTKIPCYINYFKIFSADLLNLLQVPEALSGIETDF